MGQERDGLTASIADPAAGQRGRVAGHARGYGTRSASAGTEACSAAAWRRPSRRTTAPLPSMVAISSAVHLQLADRATSAIADSASG
ncbi:hypothetical protein [Streptomyces sp. NPDC094472]|uniref:hypothetical protein n=1 Tax=unclassified Streptomyces TaxID=2593676 RepID=UPI0033323085